MPIWTVSQKFWHLQWRRLFKELWSRRTKKADFVSSFWQIHHAKNISLLEDKIQNWGMYLSTIYFGSYAVDQIKMELVHSVDDLKSSLSKKGTHGPKLWVARRENSFIHCTESSRIPASIKSVWENRKTKKRTASLKADRFLDLRLLPGHWRPKVLSRIMPTYLQLVFEMMMFRNSIRNETQFLINDANLVWWHLRRIFVQIKNMRVW